MLFLQAFSLVGKGPRLLEFLLQPSSPPCVGHAEIPWPPDLPKPTKTQEARPPLWPRLAKLGMNSSGRGASLREKRVAPCTWQ